MDFCAHPDYIAPLKSELAIENIHTIDRLPLLDSFLKESARLNGTEWSTSVTFLPSYGTHANVTSFRPQKGT